MAIPYAVIVQSGVRTPYYTRAEYVAALEAQGRSERSIQALAPETAPSQSYMEQVIEDVGDVQTAVEYATAAMVGESVEDIEAIVGPIGGGGTTVATTGVGSTLELTPELILPVTLEEQVTGLESLWRFLLGK